MTNRTHEAPAGAGSNIALNGLRALVALAIMTSHWSEGLGLDRPFMPQNGICVDFFFAIEGYLTAAMLADLPPGAKLAPLLGRQYVKILPLHWLSLLAGFVFVTWLGIPLITLNNTVTPLTSVITSGALNAALLPTFLGPWESVVLLNPPAWAIILEIFAFGSFCVLRQWLSLRSTLVLTLLGAVLYIGMALHLRDINLGFKTTGYWGGWPRCLYGFCGGASLYFLLRKIGPVLPRLHPILIWILFLAVPFISIRRTGIPLVLIAMPLIVWAAAVASNPTWLRGVTDQAKRVTYALYLVPFPLLGVFRYLFPEDQMPHTSGWYLLYYALVVLTVVGVAYLLTMLVTEPLARMMNLGSPETYAQKMLPP